MKRKRLEDSFEDELSVELPTKREKRSRSESEHEGTETDEIVPTPVSTPQPDSFLTLLAAIDAEEQESALALLSLPYSAPAPVQPPVFESKPLLPSLKTVGIHSIHSTTSSATSTPMASPILNYEMAAPFPMIPVGMNGPYVSFTAY